MGDIRRTFPNGSKVIPIRLDPIVELEAKEKANKIGKSISYLICGLIEKNSNDEAGYIISDNFPLE